MEVREFENNDIYRLIDVLPWPQDRIADAILITQVKTTVIAGLPPVGTTIRIGTWRSSPALAREYAEAILKACEIAEALEKGTYDG